MLLLCFFYSTDCGGCSRDKWCSAGFSIDTGGMCDNADVLPFVSAADRDCAVGREALQLCSSQHGAVAVVSVRGSWRAALGAGKQLFSLLSQTSLSKCRLAGLVYLEFYLR